MKIGILPQENRIKGGGGRAPRDASLCTPHCVDDAEIGKSLFSSGTYLYAVVASRDAALLDVDVGRRMSEFTLLVTPGALSSLEFPADFHLKLVVSSR